MRALAHPVRVALLELLSRDGPMTATQAGEVLDESPANISFHLRTLAKYGFVEEAPGGTGRQRPWRRVGIGNSLRARQRGHRHGAAAKGLADTSPSAPSSAARVGADPLVVPEGVARRRVPVRTTTYLTPAELDELGEELRVFDRYSDRPPTADTPAGRRHGLVRPRGHPLPPTPAGN